MHAGIDNGLLNHSMTNVRPVKSGLQDLPDACTMRYTFGMYNEKYVWEDNT